MREATVELRTRLATGGIHADQRIRGKVEHIGVQAFGVFCSQYTIELESPNINSSKRKMRTLILWKIIIVRNELVIVGRVVVVVVPMRPVPVGSPRAQ